MKNILNNILFKLEKYYIIWFLVVSLFLMFWYSFNDIAVWWDVAIYIGMAKNLATGGVIGLWEMFRPPLLPLIYALFYKLNFPLIIVGKLIVISASVGSLYLSYKIGESIKKNAGIFASIFLLITPVFFYYTKLPTTDITSFFFVLLSIWLYFKNKYFLTGLIISVAFLFRFPQGLALLPIGLMAIYDTYDRNIIIWFKNAFLRSLLIGLGFIVLVLPYFISNYFLYKGMFEPLIVGSDLVAAGDWLYNFGIFYYAKEIYRIAPYLYLSLLSPLLLIKTKWMPEIELPKNLRMIISVAFFFTLYFFWQSHQELRYSLGFIPYLAILSGVVFSYLISYIKKYKILIIILSIVICFFVYKSLSQVNYETGETYKPLYRYYGTLKGTYLSTNPMPVVFGDVNIKSMNYMGEGFRDELKGYTDNIDGVIIKDCDIYCPERKGNELCLDALNNIYNEMNKSPFREDYQIKIDECTYRIYKK